MAGGTSRDHRDLLISCRLLGDCAAAGETMVHITYKVVRHEDGWAYAANGAFSESFPTHAEALEAARRAAAEQRAPGQTETIEYEDEEGKWHTELALGSDRPETDVEDAG